VKNGPEPSISFSITWRSGWSYRESDARGLNAIIRRIGLTPSPPARFPKQNLMKAMTFRAARKIATRR
jgi:hypothetical protein